MMPKCFTCKKSKVGPGSAQVACTIDPTRNPYSAPFKCDDYEKTDDGQINYPPEMTKREG